MTAVATAMLVGTGVSLYSANKAGRQAKKAAASELAFAQEQYDDWKDIYGNLEENLAGFYEGLTPDYIETQGLQAEQQAFQTQRTQMRERFAQLGIDTGVQADIESRASLEHAKRRAEIRAEAPFTAAEQKKGFLQIGLGQKAATQRGVGDVLSQQAAESARQAESTAAMAGQAVGASAQYLARTYKPAPAAASGAPAIPGEQPLVTTPFGV